MESKIMVERFYEKAANDDYYANSNTNNNNLCVDTGKVVIKNSVSPVTSPVSSSLRKSASIRRYNCLCSPTTHTGSFRCRYHRNNAAGGLTRNSMSVGSNLSQLNKSSSNIHLIPSHTQTSSSSPSFLPAA
ncbi:hypothetical protein ABFS82_08G120500 [Erythranthe guttata]|uniref:Serine-rich protein-like protein n=1 Tax=Erythranthe guttata TaxID=4155 RepID=A0A022RT47_ERYGU|nr:hypothetical protein MIMGU_mgv1a016225mg [Erythranthe guttata]